MIQRVRALDQEAWRTLSQLYGPLVYRWARQFGLPEDDAADVTQNVFISVFRGISRFSLEGPGATFRGWLWTITRNAANELIRRQARSPRAEGGSAAQSLLQQASSESDEPPPDREILTHLTQRALQIVETSMEPRNWQAFWRTTALGEPAVEVAEALQMTPLAVRQVKYRVLCRLRDLLANE